MPSGDAGGTYQNQLADANLNVTDSEVEVAIATVDAICNSAAMIDHLINAWMQATSPRQAGENFFNSCFDTAKGLI